MESTNQDPIGNCISVSEGTVVPTVNFEKKYNDDGSYKVYGGVTIEHSTIIMNQEFDSKENRIHEMFHTFNVPDSDGVSDGILNYPPLTPNNNDALRILENNKYYIKD